MTTPLQSASTATAPRRRLSYGKKAFLALVLLGGIAFIIRNATPYIINFSETLYRHRWPVRFGLLIHIFCGIPALLTGPFQIWSGLKGTSMKLHRVFGKVYLVAVLLGASSSIYVALAQPSLTFRVSLFTLAVFWLVTTGMAYLAIINRQIALHKQWMIRSYVVTYAFVIVRLLLILNRIFKFHPGTTVENNTSFLWLSFVGPLLIAEVIMQWKSVRRPAGRSNAA